MPEILALLVSRFSMTPQKGRLNASKSAMGMEWVLPQREPGTLIPTVRAPRILLNEKQAHYSGEF
jgi:hypothetical protein